MRDLNIAVIGSGSTYTPELIKGFTDRKNVLSIKSFRMCDIDATKNKIVSGLASRMLDAAGMHPEILLTEELDEAISGADYVLAQVRVGKMEARIRDEKIPLKYGLLGQETTGVSGFMNGLRTIPVLMNIAESIKRNAYGAWLINFSNPSGLVAEALLNYTDVKMVGLCNVPYKMIKDAKEISHAGDDFDYDFMGLNHLCWLTGVYSGGRDVLNDFLTVATAKSLPANLPDIGYEPEMLRMIGGIPCGYLNYYYFRDETLKKCIDADKTRGEICLELEKELLALYQDEKIAKKPKILDKRGGACYSEAAVSLLEAIENDKNEIQVVNIRNNGTYPFLSHSDVVETRCLINKDGAHPLPLRNLGSEHMTGLIQAVKTYEKLAVKAALTGSYNVALEALLVHPLVGDYRRAKAVLDDMLYKNKEFLPQFLQI